MLPARSSRRTSASAPRNFLGCGRPHVRAARRGVTLIELLTVIVVIGILTSISLGIIRSSKQRAAIARAKSELAALAQALERYKSHYGDYPQTGGAGPANPIHHGVSGRCNTGHAAPGSIPRRAPAGRSLAR